MDPGSDPYAVLGLTPAASDSQLRHAYRELVKRHHPDHNGGSREAAARFEQVQVAYAEVLKLRAVPAAAPPPAFMDQTPRSAQEMEARLRALEQEIAARAAKDRADASVSPPPVDPKPPRTVPRRPTREELGFYDTDDSFSSIIDDAIDAVSDSAAGRAAEQRRAGEAKRRFTERLTDLFGD